MRGEFCSNTLSRQELWVKAHEIHAALPTHTARIPLRSNEQRQGHIPQRKGGHGQSFWQYRPYAQEEPATRIDWRQSGRTDTLYVKQAEQENTNILHVWADQTQSMQFRSDSALPTKADCAILLILCGMLAGSEADTLIALINEPDLRPGRSDKTFLKFLHHMMDYTAIKSLWDSKIIYEKPIKGRCLIASDGLAPLENIDKAVKKAATNNIQGCFIHILDPAECLLPWDGRGAFKSNEDSPPLTLNDIASIRSGYQERIEAHCRSIAAICRKYHWSYLLHRTDHSPHQSLSRLLPWLHHAAPVSNHDTLFSQNQSRPLTKGGA